MRAWLPFVVFALAMPVFGQPSQRVEVPLTFKEFRSVSEMIALSLGGVVGLLSGRAPKVTALCPERSNLSSSNFPMRQGHLSGLPHFRH